jgi:hypothetical protein
MKAMIFLKAKYSVQNEADFLFQETEEKASLLAQADERRARGVLPAIQNGN